MKKYYGLNVPTLGEVVLEDDFHFFLKPISRKSSIIDRVDKNASHIRSGDTPCFSTKKELIMN